MQFVFSLHTTFCDLAHLIYFASFSTQIPLVKPHKIGCLRFASLQSEVGRALLLKSNKDPDDMSSLVLVTETDSYFKADAALRIISKLNGNRLLSTVGNIGPFLPKFFNNYVYDLVAKNRYKFGEYNSCRLDGEPFMDRFIPDPCNEE